MTSTVGWPYIRSKNRPVVKMKKMTSGRKTILFLYPQLPNWEMRLYWSAYVSVLIYAWFCVYDASSSFIFSEYYNLTSELPLFGKRIKDDTNWEWSNWVPFAGKFAPILIGHSVLFNMGDVLVSQEKHKVLMLIYSMFTCYKLFTIWVLFLSILQGTIIFVLRTLIGRTISVWFGAIPILWYTLNNSTHIHDDPFIVLIFMTYTLLSYISFNLEMLRAVEILSIRECYFKMMSYVFYLPYLVSLIVVYSDFERQMEERNKKKRNWVEISTFAMRIGFWWLVIELMLHFFYFEAILQDLSYAYKLRKDRFVSLGMAIGQFFHIKYVVVFGFPAIFARLDKMEPPNGPICLARVTLYSKIWRRFDHGLYTFFKSYIFVPICMPSFSFWRRIVGVLVSYSFVLLWHGVKVHNSVHKSTIPGLHYHNIVWICLNILELFIEYGAKAFYSIPKVKNFRKRHIFDRAFRRSLAWLQIIPLVFGLYSNFYFLCGSDVGYAFVDRIFIGETLTLQKPFFVLISIGYCYCQVSMEIERLMLEKEIGAKKID